MSCEHTIHAWNRESHYVWPQYARKAGLSRRLVCNLNEFLPANDADTEATFPGYLKVGPVVLVPHVVCFDGSPAIGTLSTIDTRIRYRRLGRDQTERLFTGHGLLC